MLSENFGGSSRTNILRALLYKATNVSRCYGDLQLDKVLLLNILIDSGKTFPRL